jgi:cytochrome c-type biogenesis protein CcmH
MVLFWIICGLMIVVALWFVLPPLFQGSQPANYGETRAANLLVYQDQHRELKADLKAGLLSQDQYEQDKEELERRLLDDVGREDQTREQSKPIAGRKLGYALAIAIPISVVAFYLAVGNPKALTVDPVNQSRPAVR